MSRKNKKNGNKKAAETINLVTAVINLAIAIIVLIEYIIAK